VSNYVIWKELIEEEMLGNGETYSDIKHIQVNSKNKDWDKTSFLQSYGHHSGESFIVYTDNYIYFPTTYDGWEECECIPRHPNIDWEPKHYGGE